MSTNRDEIERDTSHADVRALNIAIDGISDMACALMGFQRTKQISRRSRQAWMNGEKEPLMQEVRARKIDIIEGALLEIYQEYVPLRQSLGEARVKRVCDIGCGQGINNVFLNIEYAPQFTLVDIEETDDQYHFWADVGSGYASLNSAKDLLVSNGAKEADVSLINPTQQDFDQTGHEFDLVTSLYSCGFHYPIDEYTELFLDTIAGGGMVILDIRKKYMKFKSPGLSHLLAQAKMGIVYEDAKSIRVKFYSSCAGDE